MLGKGFRLDERWIDEEDEEESLVVVGDADERGMFDGSECSDWPNDGFKISEMRNDFIFADVL